MNQPNKQAAKVAFISGAARRIGAMIARQLHEAGFRVVIHCNRSLQDACLLVRRLNQQRPDSALLLQKDLLAEGAAQGLIEEACHWGGRLDLLVNNASVFFRTPCAAFNEKDWEVLFAANVKAPFALSLAARPYLAEQEGLIINITDIHGEKPLKEYSVYCQTKAALIMQTKALAREFAPSVRVNAVSPGAIVWPESDNALSRAAQQEIIARTPLKRHGSPEFIAQAVLALTANPFITGQIIAVDGGRSIV